MTAEAVKRIDKLKGPNGEEVVAVTVRRAQTGPPRTVIVYRTKEGRDLVAALDEHDKVVPPVEPPAEKPSSGRSHAADAKS